MDDLKILVSETANRLDRSLKRRCIRYRIETRMIAGGWLIGMTRLIGKKKKRRRPYKREVSILFDLEAERIMVSWAHEFKRKTKTGSKCVPLCEFTLSRLVDLATRKL